MKTSKIIFAVLYSGFAIFFTGCGGNKNEQTIYIQPNYNELTWKTKEFTVKSGTQVKIVMDNIATGFENVMSHNVVILHKQDTQAALDAIVEAVGKDADKAGSENDFITNHRGIYIRTPLAPPGEKTAVVFTAPEPGKYPYICTFAGHWKSMRGIMIVIP